MEETLLKILVEQAERLTRAEIELSMLRKELSEIKESLLRSPTEDEIEKAKKHEDEILRSFAMYAQEDPDTVNKIFGKTEA